MTNSQTDQFTDPTAFLKKIIGIESISGNESELSAYLQDFLKFHGFTIMKSDVGNAVGYKGSGSPILLLSSHMDTVPTQNPFKEVDGKIFGMGAVDCKPSLASMFFSAATTEWKENEGTIILAGVVEEEISHVGMRDYFKNGIAPEFAIFGEPTTQNQICVGYKGRVLLRLKIESEPGHAACCWQYDNPAELTFHFVNKLKEFAKEKGQASANKEGDGEQSRFGEISVVLTQINAESTENTIPKSCFSSIDIRIPPMVTIADIKKKVDEIKADITNNLIINPKTKIDVEYMSQIEASESDPNTILVGALRWSIFKTINEKPALVKKTGTSFTNLIISHYNVPTITYGPGDPKLEHSDNEFIEIQEYLNVIEIYRKFFGKLKELFKKR